MSEKKSLKFWWSELNKPEVAEKKLLHNRKKKIWYQGLLGGTARLESSEEKKNLLGSNTMLGSKQLKLVGSNPVYSIPKRKKKGEKKRKPVTRK